MKSCKITTGSPEPTEASKEQNQVASSRGCSHKHPVTDPALCDNLMKVPAPDHTGGGISKVYIRLVLTLYFGIGHAEMIGRTCLATGACTV